MSSIFNVDKMERVLFTKPLKGARFNVSLTILPASTKDNAKLDAISVRTYASNKYTNADSLKSVSINTSEYISFQYQEFGDDAVNSFVMASYPHLYDLQLFLNDLYEMVNGNSFFTKKNVIKPEMEDSYVQSNGLCNDKILFAYPMVIRDNDNKKIRGAQLFFNDQEVSVVLTEGEIFQLYVVVSELCNATTMLLYTNQLLILAAVSGGASSDGEESGGSSRPPRRGSGRNMPPSRRNAFKSGGRNVPKDEDDDEEDETEVEEDDVDFDDEDEDEEHVRKPAKKSSKKAPTKPAKKSTKSSSTSKKSKKTSIEDIMKEAEEMDYDDDDDDVDFEDDDE